jgi:glucuronosyltransferase
MTFMQRLTNTLTQIAFVWLPWFSDLPADIQEEFKKYGSFDSLDELRGRSMLYLLTSDYHLDYALPMMPFMIPVPGLTAVPAKKLPEDVSTVLANSPDGAIVVSFGSYTAKLPESVASKMIAAFRGINQTVFWRYTNTDDLDIPSNVIVRDWLPQNDLLAHRKA